MPWTSFPSDLRLLIEKTLVEENYISSIQAILPFTELLSFFEGVAYPLAQRSATELCVQEVMEKICRGLIAGEKKLPTKAEKEISQLLRTFGALYVDSPMRNEKVRGLILEVFKMGLPMFVGQGITNSLIALGNLDIRWNQLAESLKRETIDGIDRVLGSSAGTSMDFSSWLAAAAKMNWPIFQSPELRTLFFQAMTRLYGPDGLTNDPQAPFKDFLAVNALPSIIFSLHQLGLSWEELPEDVQEAFFQGISLAFPLFTSKQLANIIYG